MKFALLGSMLAVVGLAFNEASNCGGNCPQGGCTKCFCGEKKQM